MAAPAPPASAYASTRFNTQTRLDADKTATTATDDGNRYMQSYMLTNFFRNDTCPADYRRAVDREPGVYPAVVDTEACVISQSSDLRNGVTGNQMTAVRDRSTKSLTVRPEQGPAFRASGQMTLKHPDRRSELLMSAVTREKKTMQEPYAPYPDATHFPGYIPLVPHLRENVQNVRHIMPTAWVPGGMSTRAVVRNMDYATACGYK
jgi:hypothetical protein